MAIMAWVKHWICQVGAPSERRSFENLGDWPGPFLENDQGGRRFRMHTPTELNVGDFDAETVHAGLLDKESTAVAWEPMTWIRHQKSESGFTPKTHFMIWPNLVKFSFADPSREIIGSIYLSC